MINDVKIEPNAVRIIRELREVIVALDRWMPQVERVGEVEIARAAAGLRIEALRRIEELEGEIVLPPPRLTFDSFRTTCVFSPTRAIAATKASSAFCVL